MGDDAPSVAMRAIACTIILLAVIAVGANYADANELAVSSDSVNGCIDIDADGNGTAVITHLDNRGRIRGTVAGVAIDLPSTKGPTRSTTTYRITGVAPEPTVVRWGDGHSAALPLCAPAPTTTVTTWPTTTTPYVDTTQPTTTTSSTSTTTTTTTPTTTTTSSTSTPTTTTPSETSTPDSTTTTEPSEQSTTSTPGDQSSTTTTEPETDDTAPHPSGELPRTGSTTDLATIIGFALIAAGTPLILLSRMGMAES